MNDGCWNCLLYSPEKMACTIRWNNGDDDFYNPDLDDREPTYVCNDHEFDKDADPNDWFEGNI